jgi:hypothetical protein
MPKKSLELALNIAGGGAFGMFLRWLEDQLAFNELGLAEKSAFHILLLLYLLAVGLTFRKFCLRYEKEGLCVPDEIGKAFRAEELLYVIARRAIGALMTLSGVLVLMTTETDKYPGMLRLLGILAILSGLFFMLLHAELHRLRPGVMLMCVLSLPQLLMFAVWLIYTYRTNASNTVPWVYMMEVATVSMGMVAFFRLAGYAFGAPNWKRCLFDCCFTAVMFLMSLADERYLALQLVFFSGALMLIYCAWVMVKNLEEAPEPAQPQEETQPDDGFEHL